jgi:hypothetical protein
MELCQIDGDLSLRTDVSTDCRYRARAHGDVAAWFPEETNAQFTLKAKGRISASLPDIETREPGRVQGQAGAGEATIDLDAGGDLFVQVHGHQEGKFDAWAAMDSISEQIETEIAQHLGGLYVDAKTQQEIDRALLTAEKEIAKAQQRIEQEQHRAQERAARAQERAAQAARRAQEKLARRSRRWGVSDRASPSLFGPILPSQPPRAKDRGPSSQEQLAILTMLQEKKITVEEAEALLAALGG